MKANELRAKLANAIGNYCAHAPIPENYTPEGDCAQCTKIGNECFEAVEAIIAQCERVARLEGRIQQSRELAHNWYGGPIAKCDCRDCNYIHELERELAAARKLKEP